ncbi:MAG: MBL fold metallo-hydrolase [Gemmatimonadaceae bacterium]
MPAMRYLTLLLVLLLSVGRAPRAMSQDASVPRVKDDAVGCIRVRASPQAAAAELGCVYAGAQLRLVGSAPYWWRIETLDTPPRVGWVAKKFIQEPTAPPSTETTIREDAWLEVHFVDVGQGDAIWIRTFDDGIAGNRRYDGRNIVIDGGPDGSDGSNAFLRYLYAHAHQGAVIDAMILSHPHDDHYPGAIGLLRHFDVMSFYDGGFPKTGVKYANFRSVVDGKRVGGQPIRQYAGMQNFATPNWGSELRAEFLYAWPGAGQDTALGSASTLENNASVVLKLTYGDHSFLFMGDAEGKGRNDPADEPRYVERRLLANPGAAALRSTVLKVAHHGSETSSTLPFIRAVDPRYVVVMSGRRSYGGTYLPDASTLGRYCAHNPETRILRTDQDDEQEGRTASTDADGDHIVIRTNGKAMLVQAYSAGVQITPTACRP